MSYPDSAYVSVNRAISTIPLRPVRTLGRFPTIQISRMLLEISLARSDFEQSMMPLRIHGRWVCTAPMILFVHGCSQTRRRQKNLVFRNNEFDGPGGSRREFEETVRAFFDDRFGILSLTERWDSIKMWAHYADTQKGFVIEFDFECLDDAWHGDDYGDVLGRIHKVSYTSERAEVTWQQRNLDDADRDRYLLDNFLLTKLQDWVEEVEWRVILPFRDADARLSAQPHDIYLFNYPLECVTGVIFGIRTSPETCEAIIRTVKGIPGISLTEVRPAEEVYKLERHPYIPR